LFIGATFVAMENHRTDSIPNDSYPVKSDRLLESHILTKSPESDVEDHEAGRQFFSHIFFKVTTRTPRRSSGTLR